MKRRPIKKVGEILIEKGFITLEQLTIGLADQKKQGSSLGSSLVRLGFIEYKKLENVLAEELNNVHNRKIGEILLESKAISGRQLAEALKMQKKEGKLIGELLVEMGFITSQQLFDALSTQFDIKSVNLDRFLFNSRVVSLLPLESARTFKAIPLSIVGDRLLVALNEPFNQVLLKEIQAIVNMTVSPVFAPMEMIVRAIDREFRVGIPEEEIKLDEKVVSAAEAKCDAVKRIIDLLLSRTVSEGAGFIHLEPSSEGHLTVRLRIDGHLHAISPVPKEIMQDVIDCLKGMAKLFVNNRRIIQSGYFIGKYEARESQFKLSTFPVLTDHDTFAEKITIKVLDRDGSLDKLSELGMTVSTLENYTRLFTGKNGVILVSGLIDSGVTTTLYASLRHLKKESLNIATIERSIDTFIPGISQTQVDMAKGFSFKEGLNSIILEDADVIMVSEIEDSETAYLVFQAAMNGRLVLSSLHSKTMESVLAFLKECSLEPALLSTGLKGVLLQNLVRRICINCREVYYPNDDILETLHLEPRTPFFRGRGCEACGFTGYKGRTALFELLIPDDKVKASIISGAGCTDIIRMAYAAGMTSLRMDGLKKVLAGITTIDRVLGVSFKEPA